jgi:deoxycytidylate deaminase
MPITATTERVAQAINKLRDELEYGDNHAYSITVNSGMTIAQHGMYGIEHPMPIVHNLHPTMYIVAQDEIVIATDSQETRICYNFGAFTTRESAQKVADEQNAKIDAKESGMEDEGEYYVLGIPIKV